MQQLADKAWSFKDVFPVFTVTPPKIKPADLNWAPPIIVQL